MADQRKRRSRPSEGDRTPAFAEGQNMGDDTIDLMELMYKLLERWKLILCLTLAFAVAAGGYTSFFVTPMYQATSTLYVLNRSDSVINMSDLQIGTALTSDYIKVFKMWGIHEEVIANLGLPYTCTEMDGMLSSLNCPAFQHRFI